MFTRAPYAGRPVSCRFRQDLQDTGPARGQPVALAASMMTFVTVLAREIIDRCPALTSMMWAWACWAMEVSTAGGMTRSAVPITAQDGMVAQAGGPEGSNSVLSASGRWMAAMTAAWGAGRPLAKQPGTTSGLM